MRKRRKGNWSYRVVSAATELSSLGLKLGGVVFFILAVYIIYGFQSGAIQNLAGMKPADQARIVYNMAFVCRVLGVTGLIVAISSIVLFYAEEVLAYMLSLVGALLYFTPPLLFASYAGASAKHGNAAVAILVAQLQSTGLVLFVPGSVLVVRDLLLRLANRMRSPKSGSSGMVWGREDTRHITIWQKVYGNCWDMPHCREFVRKLCPAYQARSCCWRMKSGCYCDETTILKAMAAKGNSEYSKNAGFSGLTGGGRGLSAAQKRARCRNCAIYTEHQRQKYRLVSPMVFPAVAIALWWLTPSLQMWLQSVVVFTDQFMKFVSFAPKDLASSPAWANQFAGSSTIQWLFIAWLGIMSVSYLLQLVEYFIFKVQI